MMVGRNLDQLFPEKNESFGPTTLNVVGISDGSRFEDVNIDVLAGEVVGIVGLLGSGSEEIVDSLVGLRKIKSGRIQINGINRKINSPASALKQGLVLIPRDRRNDGLVLNLSVDENINLSTMDAVSRLGLVNRAKARLRAEASVKALDIRPSNTKIMARLLSGGNQQKVVLARSLAAEAKILILDEPTIGVDVGAKSEIYRLVSDLSKEGRAILISSNDPSEILGLCHRVLVVMRGKVVSTHLASDLTRGELVARMTGSQAAKEMGA
jgi:ribose transport system ATP-binding protein